MQSGRQLGSSGGSFAGSWHLQLEQEQVVEGGLRGHCSLPNLGDRPVSFLLLQQKSSSSQEKMLILTHRFGGFSHDHLARLFGACGDTHLSRSSQG